MNQTRYCIVAPSDILLTLGDMNLLGSSHLLLAHDVLLHQDAYSSIFYRVHRMKDRYVILDNSAIELGNAVDVSVVQAAATIVVPTCIVLPDVLEDCDGTIKSCEAALLKWPAKMGYYTHPNKGSFLVIPQGKTLKEFTRCAEHFADYKEITHWGVPRNLVKNIGSRWEALHICHLLNPQRPIHMMGFSDNLIDDVLCVRQARFPIYSIDSAVPIRVSDHLTLSSEIPPRGDWWDSIGSHYISAHTRWNLETVRRWFNDPIWSNDKSASTSDSVSREDDPQRENLRSVLSRL